MVKFEGYERRIDKINEFLKANGIASLEECKDLCLSKGIDVDTIVKSIQPIAFDNASWAYTLGAALALKKGCKTAADAAETIGAGLQAFCRSRLRCRKPQGRSRTRQPRQQCFSAMIQSASASSQVTNPSQLPKVLSASQEPQIKSRKTPLRVILNGLGKDAAFIISRINGFTYVETELRFLHRQTQRRERSSLLHRRKGKGQGATAPTTFSKALQS